MMFWSIFFDTTAAYCRVVTSVMPPAAIPTIGDLPVRIVLPPSGTGHSQADREPAQDQGMPNHGSLSANDFGVSGSFLAAGRLKPMPFPRRRSIVEARAAFVQSGHHMLGVPPTRTSADAARGMTG